MALVGLELVSEGVVADLGSGLLDELPDHSGDDVGVLLDTDDVLALLHQRVELFIILGIVLGQSVNLSKLANCLEELICGASKL